MKRRLSTAVRNAMVSVVAVLLILIAVGFLSAAGFLALLELMRPLYACLLATALFLGLAALALLFRQRPPSPFPRRMMSARSGATGSLPASKKDEGDANRLMNRLPDAAVLALPAIAFLAALLLGRRK